MWKVACITLASIILLSACTEREKTLKGERIDVRVPLALSVDRVSDPDAETITYADLAPKLNAPRGIQLSPVRFNSEWPQLNGGSAHTIRHPALSLQPQRLWTRSIGSGNSKKQRISASPVIGGGFVFALDSQSNLTIHTKGGDFVRKISLVPTYESGSDASSGGLAYDNGFIFVTTGFGELRAYRPESGDLIWIQKFDAPAIFAPTVADDLVFVITQDSQAWGIDRLNGRLRWNWQSPDSPASTPAGSTPAIWGDSVILPFPSGEIVMANYKTGRVNWRSTVGGARGAAARSVLPSVSGAPVIKDGVVYAANQAGRMSAFDLETGLEIWSVSEGSYSPVWPEAGSVFLVSDAAELIRLDASSGEQIWASALPSYKSSSPRRRKAVFANFGPVLAGGRMLVASSDGLMRHYDPVTGNLLATSELPSGAAAAPIVADATLYVIDDRGNLTAFR